MTLSSLFLFFLLLLAKKSKHEKGSNKVFFKLPAKPNTIAGTTPFNNE